MAQVVEQLTAVIGADITGLMSGLNAAKGALGTFAALGAATLGFGVAVKTAAEFDKSLKNIQATANLSDTEMVSMNKQLLEMGKNSTYGANQVASAMYDVVGGVQDSSKWMGILEQSLATAEAGQANLKATTEGMIYIMNSYSYSAKQASMVSDVFTRTVGVGVGTMDQFVAAMAPIAITAKTLKVDFKDLGSMAAYLTTKGNSASESATQLQSAMQALLKPNNAMEAALKKLGYSSGSAAIKQLGFIGTLKALKKQAGGSTDALAQIFGRVEGFKGVLSLTNGEFENFNKNFQSGVSGATGKAQLIQLKSFDAQLKKLQASIETLAIQVGQVLLPPLIKFINFITDGIDALMKMNPALVSTIAGVLALGTGLAIALPIVMAIGAALGVLLGPVGLVIAGIVALAKAWETNFLGIRDTLQPVVDAVGEALGLVQMFISGFFDNKDMDFGTRFALLFEGLKATAIGLGSKLSKWFEGIKIAIIDLGNKIVVWVKDMFVKIKIGFQALFAKVGAWLVSGGAGQLVYSIVETIKTAVSGAANWIVNEGIPAVVDAFRSLVAKIQDYFSGIGGAILLIGIKSALNQFVNWIQTTAVPFVQNGIAAIGNGIYTTFQRILEIVGNWLASGGAGELMNSLATFISNAITGAVQWIQTVGIPALLQGLQSLVGGVQGFLSGTGGSAFQKGIETAIQQLSNWISTSAWPTVRNGFEGLLNGIIGWIGESIPKIIKGFEDMLGKVGEWLSAGGPGKLAEGLAGLFAGIATWITTTAVPSIVGAFRTLWDGVVAFFQSEGVQKFITGLGDWLKQTYTWFTDVAMPAIVDAIVQGFFGFFKWLAGDGSRNFQTGVRNWFTEAINWVGTVAIPKLIKMINDFIAEVGRLGGKIVETLANSVTKGLTGVTGDTKINVTPKGISGTIGGGVWDIMKGILGKRAGGGSVQQGGAYMVGERGPELFTPNRSGTIIPAGAMAGGGYGGPSTIEVVLRAEDFEKRIYVNVAGAIRNAR